ncbi:MAG: glycoside hydrolase family 3 protein [Treponema sp.]
MKKIAACICFLLYAAALFSEPAEEVDFWSQIPNEELARTLTDKMTDTELLSQILMFGWAGAEPEDLLFRWVERGLGSVKVFGWNTGDLKLLAKSVSALQKSAARRRFKIPLFVATDQEGGWIRHVKGETALTPGNMAIGASGYPSDAWYSAFYISREIKALGINMNFAPTLDLFTNRNSTIIGTRSFGSDPAKAALLGSAFAAGSLAAGVIPTAKHFPGHGATAYDSHVFLPRIEIDFETFASRELVPFKRLIRENIPAIMSGHLSFPQIDKTGAPASLSKYFLTDLLRGELGYAGLIITDDMMMNGAAIFAGSLTAAFRLAIEAGNDILISSTTAELSDELWTDTLKRMAAHPEFRARVKDAAFRVLSAKLDYFKGGSAAPLYPEPEKIGLFIPDRDGQKFFLEQACRSITVVKQTALPLSAEKAGNVLLAGSLPRFFDEGKKRYKNAGEFRFPYELSQNGVKRIRGSFVETAAAYDSVVICVSSAESAALARALKNSGKKVVVFSIMSPVNAAGLEWADEIILGYSYSSFSFAAMFGALYGEFEARGAAPFTDE